MGWYASAEQVRDEAERYPDLKFLKKSKNVLAVFVLGMASVSLLGMPMLFGLDDLPGVLLGVLIYYVLAVFIYLNHRWAMVAFIVVYLTDKVLLVLDGVGFPAGHAFFGTLAAFVTYRSVRVATELKRIGKI